MQKTQPKTHIQRSAPQSGSWGRKVKVGEWEDDELSEGDFDTEEDSLDAVEDKKAVVPPTGKSAKEDTKEKKDRQTAKEDAEIAALEKRLGIAGRAKLPKSFEEDGLVDILGELEDGEGSKRKRDEGREWLERKRRRREQKAEIESGSEDDDKNVRLQNIDESIDEEEDGDGLDDLLGVSSDEESGEEEDDELEEDQDPFDMSGSGEDSDPPPPKRVRENPYVAPGASSSKPESKYIPPSLRGAPDSDAEANARLKRQTQGLLNKLSEANIISILGDVEKLYSSNPRQYVTTCLLDILMGLAADRTVLNDTFIILHAGFITAVYKIIGPDFGAQLLERLVQGFDEEYRQAQVDASLTKAPVNLMSLLTQLYNFQMISCALIFDFIRFFLDSLSETNTELLLRIVRLSGSQLRQDDPSALKDIVLLLQKTIVKTGEGNLSVRTKFMVEAIDDLKNNKTKAGATANAITAEHGQRMKRTIGTLNQRNVKATEPLRITLADVRDSGKKGKWWLVGASWKGHDTQDKVTERSSKDVANLGDDAEQLELEGEVSLEALARSQGMNNPVRRAIFSAIMSAVDPADAYARVLRLNLKRKQESEIPHVLLHCVGAEASYNPYYTVLARRILSEMPKLRRKFEFVLWDLFKRMGENKDDDDDSADEDGTAVDKLSMPSLVSYAKLYADLVVHNMIRLTAFKALDYMHLHKQTVMFMEVFFITLILTCSKKERAGKTDGKSLVELFDCVLELPRFATGLQFFLERHISKTELASSKSDRKKIAKVCGELVQLLQIGEDLEGDHDMDADALDDYGTLGSHFCHPANTRESVGKKQQATAS